MAVEKKSPLEYVHFGVNLNYIRLAAAGEAPYPGDKFIQNAINELLEGLETLNLRVSINSSTKLKALKERFDKKYTEENEPLSESDKDELIACMRVLEVVIPAEILEQSAFFPTEKRYNPEFLYSDIGAVIGSDVYEALPANAKKDIEYAGQSILVEQPTSAAFHIMRACECTLKQLYYSVVKRGRNNPAMWGNMVEHLVEKKVLNEAQKGTLDIFRKGFRNPTAHPDTFYSIDQAQDLLATTAQLLNQLTSHEKYDREAT